MHEPSLHDNEWEKISLAAMAREERHELYKEFGATAKEWFGPGNDYDDDDEYSFFVSPSEKVNGPANYTGHAVN
jgi:hypothetical protein